MGSVHKFPSSTNLDKKTAENLAALRGMLEFARLSAADLGDSRLNDACDTCCTRVDELMLERMAPR